MSADGSELRAVSSAERTLDARTLAAMRSVAQRKGRQRRADPQSLVREVTSGIVCFCGERFSEDRALEFMLHLRAEYGEVLEWQEKVRESWRRSQRRFTADPDNRAASNERRSRRQRERRADPELGGLVTELEREARLRWLSDPEKKAALLARKRAYARERRQKLGINATCPICGNAFAQYSNGTPKTCSPRCGQQLRRLRGRSPASALGPVTPEQ